MGGGVYWQLGYNESWGIMASWVLCRWGIMGVGYCRGWGIIGWGKGGVGVLWRWGIVGVG